VRARTRKKGSFGVSAVHEAGCEKVYPEKVSGAKTDRAALAKAIAVLAEGDTLIVTKLDRLARSTRYLLNTLAAIAAAGATFKSLGDPWCDTTTPHGRLMLTVLGGFAEFERHLILTRNRAKLRSEPQHNFAARIMKWARRLRGPVWPFHHNRPLRSSDHGYANKSRSFCPLILGNNQSLSSSFLTSVSNPGGKSWGT
jgi:hypothetical protein